MQQSKQCVECDATFHRAPGRSNAQWASQTCCTARCANTQRARGRQRRPGDLDRSRGKAAYQVEWQRRNAMPRWAAWWEHQRQVEDLAELATPNVVIGRAAVPTSSRPNARQFIAGYCACGKPWIDYRARQPSGYCNRCQTQRWAADSRHKRRAWKAAAAIIDVISHEEVFKRDGYRCQLCKRKTRGRVPSNTAPTLDHIIPLSRGGEHSYLNVQCACFECNSRKGAGAANDQLRLLA